MKIGIIRCRMTEDYCPGTSDFKAIRERSGVFAEVPPEEPIELIGFNNCGGCPGKKAVLRARELVKRGADTIVFASCIQKGNPIGYPCPFASDPELAETVAVLEQKAEAMSTLVGQFYDYSRLAADDMNLTLTRIDAGRVLRETLAGSYQLLANAHLKVDIDLPEHPLWVLGDQAALARIFQNLLQNAGRYAETCLALAANEESDHLTLRFSNDTTRLNDDDVAHLFDRFYTPDASRHQGGTGLGLTVARTLAEDMQGSLTASADTHDGKHLLTFTLTLKML